MAWGLRLPLRKTPSPSRVTSRSWCKETSLPLRSSAMLSRTEFEPISTAAKTGIRYQAIRAWPRTEEAGCGCFLGTGASEGRKLDTAEPAAEYLAAKRERISTSKGQF